MAVFGSLLAGSYRGSLDTAALPAEVAHKAEQSVVAADAVAAATGDRALAASAHAAYVHGMTVVLLASGAIAVLSAVLVALRMPSAEPRAAAEAQEAAEAAAQAAEVREAAAADAGSQPGSPSGTASVPASDHG